MKIARVLWFAFVVALVAAPLHNAALAVWPFSSSTTTTTTNTKKKMPTVSATKTANKKQPPSTMQKLWNGVTSPFSSDPKPATKKPSKPLGYSGKQSKETERKG